MTSFHESNAATAAMPGSEDFDLVAAAADAARAPWSDGDASIHLEELLAGHLAPLAFAHSDEMLGIELVGPHLRVAASLNTGYFRRLSDFLNHHDGLIELHDATILRRNGDPTKVTAASLWVSPNEVTLIGQPVEQRHEEVPAEFRVPKIPKGLIVVTPGHTLTGHVYITPEAELSGFVESPSPTFIPMTDVRARSLADRRVISRYPFALLNRRHIVAATELQPGMAAGRNVL